MHTRTLNKARRGFTLIEILIVVVILGILAAIVIPQFTDASQEASESSVRSQLQTLRSQIELFRVEDPAAASAWNPVNDGWTALIDGDYIQAAPKNPLQNSTTVAAAAAADVGWVWRDKGNGTMMLYAVDSAGAEFDES